MDVKFTYICIEKKFIVTKFVECRLPFVDQ